MPNNNIHQQLNESLSTLAFVTKKQQELFKKNFSQSHQTTEGQNNSQNAPQSPQNAPEQEIEGKQENIAEKGKEEPNEANKAQKIPQDDKFKSQVLDELASLKAEVEQLLQGEAEEKKEEDSEQTNEPGKEE